MEDGTNLMGKKPFQLIITNLRAANLVIADLTASDPYIIFSIDGIRKCSTVIKYKNLNPSWVDEAYKIDIISPDGVLTLQVYDYDQGKDPDSLGSISLRFKENMKNTAISETLKDVRTGSVSFTLTISVISSYDSYLL